MLFRDKRPLEAGPGAHALPPSSPRLRAAGAPAAGVGAASPAPACMPSTLCLATIYLMLLATGVYICAARLTVGEAGVRPSGGGGPDSWFTHSLYSTSTAVTQLGPKFKRMLGGSAALAQLQAVTAEDQNPGQVDAPTAAGSLGVAASLAADAWREREAAEAERTRREEKALRAHEAQVAENAWQVVEFGITRRALRGKAPAARGGSHAAELQL